MAGEIEKVKERYYGTKVHFLNPGTKSEAYCTCPQAKRHPPTSTDWSKVTCKRCLLAKKKILSKGACTSESTVAQPLLLDTVE
jgi:hypothetical protein